MNIFYYSTFSNEPQWIYILKKKFKNHKIFTIKDNFEYGKIDVAIVWNVPSQILKKLLNVKVIFSLGAGVDHIINLSSYKQTPIFRIKDPNMRERMFNHTLSQVLNYQLKLNVYQKAQQKNLWLNERETPLNKKVTIGILGFGYLGQYIARNLENLNYNIIAYKNSKLLVKESFKVYFGNKIDHFISSSDIIVSILPSTEKTKNFINKNFLKKMKKNSLLINLGRGHSLNEDDLISFLKSNKNVYASLDVFKKEPLKKSHKFWSNPNITITPHIAAVTDIESSVDYIYKRLLTIKKHSKIVSDVNLKIGY